MNYVQEAMVSNFVAPDPSTPAVQPDGQWVDGIVKPSEPLKIESKGSLSKHRRNQW
jgi:hypothetical protein